MRILRYPDSVPQSCRVSFSDINGITHSVEVPADSLYEAVTRAVVAFRQVGLVEVPIGRPTEFAVAAIPAAVEHRVTYAKLEDWLQSSSRSPRERIRKLEMQELLSG